ncbi:thiamine-phosphate kinase [Stygiolobus azoricus]
MVFNSIKDDVYTEKNLIYKIDGFQLSYTFPFMDLYDLGWKAVISTVSDIISKGGIPSLFFSSIGIPKSKLDKLESLIEGIADAIKYYNGKYVGGDLNSSDGSGWIDIMGIGLSTCNSNKDINDGDVVIISNSIGYTSLVFLSYVRSWNIHLPNKVINKIRHPIVNKGIVKTIEKYCTNISYSTDVSDGLIISLYNIVKRKNVTVELKQIPIDPEVKEMTDSLGVEIKDILKYSGEEFETLLVVRKSVVEEVMREMRKYGLNPIVIGEVIKNENSEERNNVLYKGEVIENTGWDNFLGWF